MPEIASRSAYAVAGRSGLPKLRQLVIAAGSAPLHATFRTACATASRPPRRGSSATRAPSPSSATATARFDGVRRTTAASPPGRSTVPEPTSWSYWAYTHALEQTFGRASSRSRSAEASRRLGDRRERERRVGEGVGPPRLERVGGSVGERCDREVADDLAGVLRDETVALDHAADRRARQLVARADGLDVGQPGRLDHRRHALLRLRDHDLERVHPCLAQRHVRELDLEPDPAARGHLGKRRREAGGAEILQRDDEAALRELERALEQLLPGERVADLDRRALVGALLVEILRGEHARAADAVAPGRGAVEHDQVPGARGRRAHELTGLEHAEAHRVDERVVAVGRIEDRLAADVRDADAVAVSPDAAHDPVEQAARPRLVERAEPQRVEDRDRARAHREHVAQDAADPGGRSLVGLDRGRVVVALDLEGEREAVADVDHAGVLAGALQDARAIGRQPAELGPGVLVAAVLRPEQGEDRELEVVRLPAHQLDDALQLAVGQPKRAMDRRFEGGRHVCRAIVPDASRASGARATDRHGSGTDRA